MNEKKKHAVLIALICCIIVLSIFFLCIVKFTKLAVECYYYDPCGGCFTDQGPCKPCSVETGLMSKYSGLISNHGLDKNVDFKFYNILFKPYKQKYDMKLRQHNLSGRDDVFPIIFIGNSYLVGENQIENKLIPTIYSSNSLARKVANIITDSYRNITQKGQTKMQTAYENVIVYFSMPGCEDCGKVDQYLENIKRERLKDNEYKIIKYTISKSENLGLLKQYSVLYGVESKEAVVPVVFVGERYLVGYEEISQYLRDYLNLDENVHTCVLKAGR